MNLHIKTGLGIKNYVLDPNSNVEYEIFLTDFSWQIWAKNTKLNFSSESVKTKEHKESNSCEKYYFLIDAFYKINFWPILKKLSQKIDFRHFPLFEIIALLQISLFWWQLFPRAYQHLVGQPDISPFPNPIQFPHKSFHTNNIWIGTFGSLCSVPEFAILIWSKR